MPRRRLFIGLILALGFLLRADLLGTPFIEYFSNREVQNALPARLFLEGTNTFWNLPIQITEDHVVVECQILPLIVHTGYRALERVGLAHAPARGDVVAAERYYRQIALLGRLWSVLMALATIYLLFRLVGQGWSERAGLLTACWYALLPYNRFFDQLFLSEPTLMALACFGLYQVWRWSLARRGAWGQFALAAPAFAILILLKVSHAFIGIPIAYLVWRRLRWRALWNWPTWLFGFAVLFPSIYFYELRGSWIGQGGDTMPVSNLVQLFTSGSYAWHMVSLLVRRYVWSIITPLGALLCVLGLRVARRNADARARGLPQLLLAWGAGWIAYWFMAGQMSGHLYYQAPSVPIVACLLGIATAWLTERYPAVIHRPALAVFALYCLLWNQVVQRENDQDSRFWRGTWCWTVMDAGLAVDRRLPTDAVFISGSRDAVARMLTYYAHRKARLLTVDDLGLAPELAPRKLETLRREGASYYVAPLGYDGPKYNGIVFDRAVFGRLPVARYLFEHYPVVEETDSHVIFALAAPLPAAAGSLVPPL
jgi:Dolichyl-phosphate-mannose-protein mannosyltransferase